MVAEPGDIIPQWSDSRLAGTGHPNPKSEIIHNSFGSAIVKRELSNLARMSQPGEASPLCRGHTAQPGADGAQMACRIITAAGAALMAASVAASSATQALTELKTKKNHQQMERFDTLCCRNLMFSVQKTRKQSCPNGGGGAGTLNSI